MEHPPRESEELHQMMTVIPLPENPPLLSRDSTAPSIKRWRFSCLLNLGCSCGWLWSLEGGGSDAGQVLSRPPEAGSTVALSFGNKGSPAATWASSGKPTEGWKTLEDRERPLWPESSETSHTLATWQGPADRWVSPGETRRSTLVKDAQTRELSERLLCWAAKLQTGCYLIVCKTLVLRLGPTSWVPGQHQGAHTVGGSLLLSFHGSSFPSSLLTAL